MQLNWTLNFIFSSLTPLIDPIVIRYFFYIVYRVTEAHENWTFFFLLSFWVFNMMKSVYDRAWRVEDMKFLVLCLNSNFFNKWIECAVMCKKFTRENKVLFYFFWTFVKNYCKKSEVKWKLCKKNSKYMKLVLWWANLMW